jgi:hypothetical protein
MITRRSILAAAPLLMLPRTVLGLGYSRSSGGSAAVQEINTRDSINGTLVNAYGIWGFGRGIVRATGAGPPGPFGAFCYVTLNGKVMKQIGTNSAEDAGKGAQQIVLDGGQIFSLTNQNDRYWGQFINYFDIGVGSPDYTPIAAVLPTPITYPYSPVSADGSLLTSTPGTLTTKDGVWTNDVGGTGYQPTLNGVTYRSASPGAFIDRMQVACNGNMFVHDNRDNTWQLQASYGGRFLMGPSIPSAPIPIIVNQNGNPAVMTPGDPLVVLSTSTSIGTVISTMSTVMSDGSTYGGPYQNFFRDGGGTVQSWAAVSGANLVTTGAPVSGFYQSDVFAQIGGGFPAMPGAQTLFVLVP